MEIKTLHLALSIETAISRASLLYNQHFLGALFYRITIFYSFPSVKPLFLEGLPTIKTSFLEGLLTNKAIL